MKQRKLEELLEDFSKVWLVREDSKLLSDFQYSMFLLTQCIESMLKGEKHLRESISNFYKYKKKYFQTLRKSLKYFNSILENEVELDELFAQSVNKDTKELFEVYEEEIKNMSSLEAKAVNNALFSFQIFLRLVNTYIEEQDTNIVLLDVEKPLIFDFKIPDYKKFLEKFVLDQKLNT